LLLKIKNLNDKTQILQFCKNLFYLEGDEVHGVENKLKSLFGYINSFTKEEEEAMRNELKNVIFISFNYKI
jgi:hypothetical protein